MAYLCYYVINKIEYYLYYTIPNYSSFPPVLVANIGSYFLALRNFDFPLCRLNAFLNYVAVFQQCLAEKQLPIRWNLLLLVYGLYGLALWKSCT